MPDQDDINLAISLLTQVGSDEYTKLVSEKNKTYMQSHFDKIITNDDNATEVSNNHNTLFEPIESYNMFDVIKYYSKGVYFFTRNEFGVLVERRTNPWTKNDLPYAVLTQIEARNKIAAEFNLPGADTLSGLLHRVSLVTSYNPMSKPTLTLPAMRRVRSTGMPSRSSIEIVNDTSFEFVNDNHRDTVDMSSHFSDSSLEMDDDIDVVMMQTGVDADTARQVLHEHDGNLAEAITSLEELLNDEDLDLDLDLDLEDDLLDDDEEDPDDDDDEEITDDTE
jgi:NACalpha-BTF3-like transcription factor